MWWRAWILGVGLMVATGSGLAEVTAAAANGFVSEHVLLLEASPGRAYRALTEEVSHWWDADHSYSGEAGNFSLEATAGGCFCEQLPDGGSVEHMRVVLAQPGRLLRMQGGLGPLQSMAVLGSMEFRLVPEEGSRTRLEYRYSVTGFLPESGLDTLAEPVDLVQKSQLERLAGYLAGTGEGVPGDQPPP